MKIYNESIICLPKARYVVENNGNVKVLGFALNAYSSLNISKQRIQRALIQKMWQRTLGNQHA